MKKKVFIILLLGVLIYSSIQLTKTFSSDNSLYYDGNSKQFTYYNSSQGDFFDDFKDLIPGDVREQTVTIRGVNIKKRTKLFIRLDTDIDESILSLINISVYKDDELLDSSTDTIEITDLNEDSNIVLKLRLEVPIEVDNIISDKVSIMRWSFLVEEDEDLIEVPNTYDSSHIIIYSIILGLSLLGLILLITNKKVLETKKQ